MKRIMTFSNIRFAIEVVLIVILVAILIARPSLSSAAPQSIENNALASPVWYTCGTPDQVAVFTNRVHVHCQTVTGSPTMPDAVHWFAVSTADSAMASRFMSIIQSAVLTTQPLYLFVDSADLSGGNFNCATGDCRRLYGVELLR